MSKAVKQLELDDLRSHIGGVRDYVLLEPIKVDSATEYNFRKTLREKKVRVKLVKNSYARKIFAEMGVNSGELTGPTILCWGSDSVKSLANAVDSAVKDSKKDAKAPDKFKVRTAILDGNPITLDVAKTVPTRLEAIGEIVNALAAAGSAIAGCLVGPGSQIASILTTIEETPVTAPASEVPAAEAPAAEAPAPDTAA